MKPRRKNLFRPQAVEVFVGVHGDSSTPELLYPPRRRLAWLMLAVTLMALWIWNGAVRIPVRKTLEGEVLGSESNTLCLMAPISKPMQEALRPGRSGHLALKSSQINATPLPAVQIVSISPAMDEGCDLNREKRPGAWAIRLKMIDSSATINTGPATLWMTVDHRTPWAYGAWWISRIGTL
ncbi:MAG: hypothetical protein HQL50_02420 [Magnetococcales bacterium]|nr:hypothetical protein [Magnetococcales bacterium]